MNQELLGVPGSSMTLLADSAAGAELELNIQAMPLPALRSYAAVTTRKAMHLEAEVERLKEEVHKREAQHSRRSQQVHQSARAREEQLAKSLKQAEFELAAERSIRQGLESEQSKLRDLCKKAKSRIAELVTLRSESDKQNGSLSSEIEILKDQLAQFSILQEQWKHEAEGQQLEIRRQKERAARLLEIIQQHDLHAQLRALVGLIGSAWKQIQEISGDKNLMQSDVSKIDAVNVLTSNLASKLPSILVDLSTMSELPRNDNSSCKANPSFPSLSTSAGGHSVSSLEIDEDIGMFLDEVKSDPHQIVAEGPADETIMTTDIIARNNSMAATSSHSEPRKVNIIESNLIKDVVKQEPVCRQGASKRSNVKGLSGLRAKLKPNRKSADLLYPVVNPVTRTSERLASSLRNVHSDIDKQQREAFKVSSRGRGSAISRRGRGR